MPAIRREWMQGAGWDVAVKSPIRIVAETVAAFRVYRLDGS